MYVIYKYNLIIVFAFLACISYISLKSHSDIKYMRFSKDGSSVCHGWRHQRQDISCMLAIATTKNYSLVLDEICIPEVHSKTAFDHTNKSDIKYVKIQSLVDTQSDFWRKNTVTMNFMTRMLYDKKVFDVKHVSQKSNWTYFYELCKESTLLYKKRELSKHLAPPQSIYHDASLIIDKITPFVGIHIRRGDKTKNKTVDEATRPANILKTIKDNVTYGTNIYIATNEYTPGFFDEIKSHYNVFTIVQFENIVHKIKYNSFAILILEELILSSAFLKVSTFKESSSDLFLV